MLEREYFTLLRHYLTDDSSDESCSSFPQKRRTCFDQYLVYRPDWLAQWKQDIWLKGWRGTGLQGAVVEGAGGIYPSTRTTALAPRQSHQRFSLIRNAGVRDDLPAGVTFARLYMAVFRVTACLSPGAPGAG
ncbi:exodeoxyribonuclease V subunit gamma [Escherichia coli]